MSDVLLLKTVRPDMTGPFAPTFKWPKSGEVVASQWVEHRHALHGGLFGLLWGCGNGACLRWAADDVWVVFSASEDDVVLCDGCAKVPRGEVMYAGTQAGATSFIYARRPGPIVGLTLEDQDMFASVVVGDQGRAIVGDYGRAVAGHAGHAIAGHDGHAYAGIGGWATVGKEGTAVAEKDGVAEAGDCGRAITGRFGYARAGVGGTLVFDDLDRPTTWKVGEHRVKPNKFYRWTAEGLKPGKPSRMRAALLAQHWRKG